MSGNEAGDSRMAATIPRVFYYDFPRICRLCLTKARSLTYIHSEAYDTLLERMIFEGTSVQVSINDGLPRQMCKKCIETLAAAALFKRKVIRADVLLRSLLAKNQPENSSSCSPLARGETGETITGSCANESLGGDRKPLASELEYSDDPAALVDPLYIDSKPILLPPPPPPPPPLLPGYMTYSIITQGSEESILPEPDWQVHEAQPPAIERIDFVDGSSCDAETVDTAECDLLSPPRPGAESPSVSESLTARESPVRENRNLLVVRNQRDASLTQLCEVCGERFGGLGELRDHRRFIGHQRYGCLCGRRLGTKRRLLLHVATCRQARAEQVKPGGCPHKLPLTDGILSVQAPLEAVSTEAVRTESIPSEADPLEADPLEADLLETFPSEDVPTEVIPLETVPSKAEESNTAVKTKCNICGKMRMRTLGCTIQGRACIACIGPQRTAALPGSEAEPSAAGGVCSLCGRSDGATEPCTLQIQACVPCIRAAGRSNQAAEPATPGKGSAEQATPSKESAEKATPSKESAEQATPSKESAEQATPSKESAEKATPSKESAEQATPSKESAEQATPSKESAEQATPSKESAEQATPSKESAEQATPSKEAAEQATPSKESAEQATYRKESAEQATPSKESAEQATPNNLSAEQATPSIKSAPSINAAASTVPEAGGKVPTRRSLRIGGESYSVEEAPPVLLKELRVTLNNVMAAGGRRRGRPPKPRAAAAADEGRTIRPAPAPRNVKPGVWGRRRRESGSDSLESAASDNSWAAASCLSSTSTESEESGESEGEESCKLKEFVGCGRRKAAGVEVEGAPPKRGRLVKTPLVTAGGEAGNAADTAVEGEAADISVKGEVDKVTGTQVEGVTKNEEKETVMVEPSSMSRTLLEENAAEKDVPPRIRLRSGCVLNRPPLGSVPCPVCGEVFPSKRSLRDHQVLTLHGRLACDECDDGTSFKTQEALEVHKTAAHTPVRCADCREEFAGPRELRAHIALARPRRPRGRPRRPRSPNGGGGGNLLCHLCGKGCDTRCRMRLHLLIHEYYTMRGAALECNLCRKVVDQRLVGHLMSEHEVFVDTRTPASLCSICGVRVPDRGLPRHMELHQHFAGFGLSGTCNVCGESVRRSAQLHHLRHRHQVFLKAGTVFCAACGDGFNGAASMAKHARLAHGPDSLRCRLCDLQLPDLRAFSTHAKSAHHTQRGHYDKPHACLVCDKRFRKEKYVTRHMRSHTGEKPFACPTCGRSFSLRPNLVAHMRQHTDEMPYKCSVCGQGFKHNVSRKNHMKYHAENAPAPPGPRAKRKAPKRKARKPPVEDSGSGSEYQPSEGGS